MPKKMNNLKNLMDRNLVMINLLKKKKEMLQQKRLKKKSPPILQLSAIQELKKLQTVLL